MVPDFTPRPTVYKGIQMRSRLEAGFAQWLDEKCALKWEYEPKAFGSPQGQYLPDFHLPQCWYNGEPRSVYVEVKPPPHFAEDEYGDAAWNRRMAVWDQMAVIWESEPDALLLVAGPGHLNRLYQDLYVRGPWIEDAAWIVEAGHVYGVATVAGEESQPWYGEWWKVGPA